MGTVTHWLLPEEAIFQTSSFAQYKREPGTNYPVSGLTFDASADEAAFWRIVATSYGSGNLTARIYWYADTASSGDVVWGAQLAAITANADTQDVETDGLAAASTATDGHLGTTGQRVHSIDISIGNLDSLAADDLVTLKIYRDADAAGDTMTGDAILLGVALSYSDS